MSNTKEYVYLGGKQVATRQQGISTLRSEAPSIDSHVVSQRVVVVEVFVAAAQSVGALRQASYFAIALSVTACVHAAAPGSFLMTGSLPPASSTFTVRW